MTIITVSRQMGAQAEIIIAGTAKLLNLRVVDRAVVGQAAQAAGVPEIVFQELTFEGQRNLVRRMIGFMDELLGGAAPAPEEKPAETFGPFTLSFGGAFAPGAYTLREQGATTERYINVINMVIRDLAAQGDVLIVGLGGQAILREEPRALHVQIIAAFEERVRRVMEREGCSRGEALRRLRASDEARADYLRRHYGLEWMDPNLYHMVLNTSHLGPKGAIRAIVAVARGMETSERRPAGRDRPDATNVDQEGEMLDE